MDVRLTPNGVLSSIAKSTSNSFKRGETNTYPLTSICWYMYHIFLLLFMNVKGCITPITITSEVSVYLKKCILTLLGVVCIPIIYFKKFSHFFKIFYQCVKIRGEIFFFFVVADYSPCFSQSSFHPLRDAPPQISHIL